MGRGLALAVSVTGILATMPYIALQLVGIQAVLEVVGLGGTGNVFMNDLPLLIAFTLLAAYTYSAGLRAPAIIAFVGDTLIYLVIIVAIVCLPVARWAGGRTSSGGAGAENDAVNPATGAPVGVFIPAAQQMGLRHTGARLGDGAVHVPALDYGDAVLAQPQHHPSQRHDPAGLQLRARAFWRCSDGWRLPRAPSRSGSTGKVNAQLVIPQLFEDYFPGVVCRRGVCRGGHRRAGARRHHVDCRREHLHAEHLSRNGSSRMRRMRRKPTSRKSCRSW